MRIRSSARLSPTIGIVLLLAYAGSAGGEAPCDGQTVRDRLARMEDAFSKPEVREKLAAAKKDWDEDDRLDSEESAKYMGTIAAYHRIKMHLAHSDAAACEQLAQFDPLIRELLGEL